MTDTMTVNPLEGMTPEKWDSLLPHERNMIMDRSDLHPKLIGYEGRKVQVFPSRGPHRKSTFIVGKSSGWKPIHLALRENKNMTSDVILPDEKIDVVRVIY